jgi:hypothetical protein
MGNRLRRVGGKNLLALEINELYRRVQMTDQQEINDFDGTSLASMKSL